MAVEQDDDITEEAKTQRSSCDYAEADRFLKLLDPEAARFTFQTFDDNADRKDPGLVRVIHGSLAENFDLLRSLNDRGAGVFVTVNETNFKGRKATDIIRARALFADFDGVPRPEDFLPPNIEVETSEDRWHHYFLVKDLALKEFTAKQQGLIAKFGSDPSIHDLPRVMRLPGFFHRKKEPRLVRVTGSSNAVYTVDQFPDAPVTTDDVPEYLKDYVSQGIGVPKPEEGDRFWRDVNTVALKNLDAWVPAIFGDAAEKKSKGEYRIKSKALKRDNDEDLSIHPDGIRDWGVHDIGDSRQGKRTPITVVIEYGGKKDATEAAMWLCQRLGIDPASLGWRGPTNDRQESKDQGKTSQDAESIYDLFWHGKKYDRALRPWLVDKLIFETGAGLAAGQWGAAKTFGVLDLSASIMTATPFAGRRIVRQGGVVFVAAEGASEIPIRLAGVVDQKLRPEADRAMAAGAEPTTNLDELPFAWLEDCPDLQDINAFNKLVRTVKRAADVIHDKFDLPIVLIVIDTLSAAGHFKDQDDAAEGQRVMNRLAELSRHSGAFVLAVDHFGKAVESGTRGTSAKEASADVVLAWLADRQLNGTISNTRMTLRKLRGGQVGVETPFNLKVVNIGDDETTCIVEWQASRTTAQASTAAKDRWPKSLRVFQAAMSTALTGHGSQIHPYGEKGAAVRAVPGGEVRREFMAAYPADGSNEEDKADAKRKAFGRALKQALDRELICSREIGGVDYLWLVQPPEPVVF